MKVQDSDLLTSPKYVITPGEGLWLLEIGPNTYRRRHKPVVASFCCGGFEPFREILAVLCFETIRTTYHKSALCALSFIAGFPNLWWLCPRGFSAKSDYRFGGHPSTAHIMGRTFVQLVFFDHAEPHGQEEETGMNPYGSGTESPPRGSEFSQRIF